MRTLSPTAVTSALSDNTSEVWLCCVTIFAGSVFRMVNNTEAVVRTVGTFTPYPFEITLPDDTESANPQVTITVDNIDREVTRQLRNYQGVPTVTVEVVLASSPNTVEMGPMNFVLKNMEYNALTITGSLGYEEDILAQAVPHQTYNPSSSSGMFL